MRVKIEATNPEDKKCAEIMDNVVNTMLDTPEWRRKVMDLPSDEQRAKMLSWYDKAMSSAPKYEVIGVDFSSDLAGEGSPLIRIERPVNPDWDAIVRDTLNEKDGKYGDVIDISPKSPEIGITAYMVDPTEE